MLKFNEDAIKKDVEETLALRKKFARKVITIFFS